MAKLKKSAVKKLTKVTKGASASKPLGGLGKIASTAKGKLGFGGKKGGFGGRRRHKKSAMWYAKEIARIKMKKRYDKVRLRI